jgi:glycerol-3-phosphate acyltransferase PlsY
MNVGGLGWMAGGYLIGTLPWALIVARAKGATALVASSRRSAGETDPHMLMWKQLGLTWAIVAGTLDVLKAFLYILAARHWGGLDTTWIAATGTAVVLGHSFPFYAREMAGRGLAASSGVTLVLLPIQMAIAGIIILIGGATRTTGLSTTIGFVSIPIIAAFQGQPPPFILMSVAILAVLMIRRVEGVGAVIRSGLSPAKAIWERCVFDSSGTRG